MIRVCPFSALPPRDVLAVYRRGDVPVAVLGTNQSRLLGRWRRQLNTAVVPA